MVFFSIEACVGNVAGRGRGEAVMRLKSIQYGGKCRTRVMMLAAAVAFLHLGCDTELKRPISVTESACTGNEECSGELICELGECVADPCLDISCDQVPAPACNGNQRVTYGTVGECRGGECFYAPTLSDCGDKLCEDGVCKEVDPCENIVCDSPPSPTCDGNSIITYANDGSCSQGVCAYESSESACEAGRQCVNANCELLCNCSPLQTCNEETGECIEPSPCFSDMHCNGPRVCVNGACTSDIPECRTNEDCSGGYCVADLLECEAIVCTQESDCSSRSHCNIALGQCVECLENAQCAGAQTCEFNVCKAATTCSDDIDCLQPQVCEAGSCVDETCSENDVFDLAAPNNVFEDATVLTFANGASGPHESKICGVDDDEWFEINSNSIQANDGLIVSGGFPGEAGRVEVFVTRGDEFSETLASGASSTGNFVVTVNSVPEPPLFLRFHATEGSAINLEFRIEVISGGLCLDTEGEPNNNSGGALNLGDNPVTEGRSFLLCQNSLDEDWFHFSADAGKEIEVRLTSDTSSVAALDLFSLHDNLTTLVKKDITSNHNKLLTHTSAGGVHYIRVYSVDGVHGLMSGAISVTTQ